MLKIWPQVKLRPDPKGSYCISVDPYHRPEHIWCFHCFSWSLSKVIAENGWRLSMTWNDLGDMTRRHRSQYSDSGSQVYLSPDVWKCFEWFLSKRGAFLPLTYNGEVPKLTRPGSQTKTVGCNCFFFFKQQPIVATTVEQSKWQPTIRLADRS